MKPIYLLVLVFFQVFDTGVAESSDRKPNILFILTDDQRWDALGCYGNQSIKTPNLDRLASEGTRLDAFFAASPVCCPSRATLLTGLYPHQTGIYSNEPPFEFHGLKTVPIYLNRAGYVTAFIGKAHLGGDPEEWGFKFFPVYLRDGTSKHENPNLVIDGESRIVNGTVNQIFIDAGIQFLEDHRNQQWFLWLATTAPHRPYVKDSRFEYNESQIKRPPGWPEFEKFRASSWLGYYSTVSMLDEQLGRILHKLEELDLAGNTFIFVTSDNGLMNGSHGIEGKGIWFDESTRLPAIIKWPGKIQPNTSNSSLFSTVDILPTLLEIAGISAQKELPGVSCLPGIVGRPPGRNTVFAEAEFKQGNEIGFWRMLRDHRWKYVESYLGSKKEVYLYEISEDRSESKDLSKAEIHSGVLAASKNQMHLWLENTRPVIPYRKKHNVDSMRLSLIEYFRAEKTTSVLLVVAAIVTLIVSFFLIKRTFFFNGIAYPLIAIGLIQLLFGGMVYSQSRNMAGLAKQLQVFPATYKAEELSRMERVINILTACKMTAIALLVVCIVLMLVLRRWNLFCAVLTGTAFQTTLMLVFVVSSQNRALEYVTRIERLL